METKTIEIYGKEIVKDNTKFIAYRAKKSDGTLIDCSFTKDCKNAPKFLRGTIVVENNPAVVQKSNKGLYPRLWIKEVISCEEYKGNVDVLSEF